MIEIDVAIDRGALEVQLACEGALAIVGPNGAGKSTLLHAIAGGLRPRSGRIAIGGRVVFDAKRKIDCAPEERRVAYVPQGFGLFPHLSVLENVVYGARDAAGAKAMLERLGISPLAARKPGSLSGGEKQRVALARALASEPRAVLLDEPLGAFDPLARPELRGTLAAWLRETGLPALVVAHDEGDVRALATEAIVLEKGRITQRGTLDELRSSPATAFAAALFGADQPAGSAV